MYSLLITFFLVAIVVSFLCSLWEAVLLSITPAYARLTPEDETYRTTREIASKEGVIAGLSSGASLWAAQQLAQRMDKGNIVVVFADRGERYFSTELFADE